MLRFKKLANEQFERELAHLEEKERTKNGLPILKKDQAKKIAQDVMEQIYKEQNGNTLVTASHHGLIIFLIKKKIQIYLGYILAPGKKAENFEYRKKDENLLITPRTTHDILANLINNNAYRKSLTSEAHVKINEKFHIINLSC